MHEFKIGRLRGECVVSWWADGKRRRYRLGTHDRKEAESKALDVIRRETLNASGETWADLWEKYRAEKSGRSVAVTMGYESKAVLGHFGQLRPDQTTIEHSRSYISLRRSQNRHDGTIWTELGHLRNVGSWAVKRRLITHSPMIERPPKPAPKDRYLTRDEIAQFLAAPMPEHTRLAILLMLGTAGRVTAILELTWDRVNFDAGVIDLRLDTTGPRKGRATVPMNAGLRSALSDARKTAFTDHVIEWAGQPVKSLKTGFRAAVKASGLKDVTPHVLRHTAGVHLAAGGMPMSRIAQYLGHTSTAVTERVYARFAPDHLREEASLLDFTTIRLVKARLNEPGSTP